MSKTFWKFWAWLSIVCGLGAYFTGWYNFLAKTEVWEIPTVFLFLDAIASFMLGTFFLIYSAHYGKSK